MSVAVKWLLERDVFHEDLDPIKDAITAAGMEYKEVRYIPLGAENKFYEYFPGEACVIPYGSINFTAAVNREIGWVPGVWGDRKHLECTHYYPQLGKYLLNDDYIMLPYGEMIRQCEFLFNTLGRNTQLFVRPSSPSKTFTGQTISGYHYEDDVKRLGFYDVEPDSLVIVSSPKDIDVEWRMIVIDGKVVAGSQYKTETLTQIREGYPEQVLTFAQEVADAYRVDDAYVIDVGLYNGMLKLIEVNSFSSSGWYLADKPAIVSAAAELAIAQHEDFWGTDDNSKFKKQLERASAIVDKWPAWKRNILNNSSCPTVAVPREPVINDE
jgi:hypothetical protein